MLPMFTINVDSHATVLISNIEGIHNFTHLLMMLCDSSWNCLGNRFDGGRFQRFSFIFFLQVIPIQPAILKTIMQRFFPNHLRILFESIRWLFILEHFSRSIILIARACLHSVHTIKSVAFFARVPNALMKFRAHKLWSRSKLYDVIRVFDCLKRDKLNSPIVCTCLCVFIYILSTMTI